MDLRALSRQLSEARPDGGPVCLTGLGVQVEAGVVLELGDQPVLALGEGVQFTFEIGPVLEEGIDGSRLPQAGDQVFAPVGAEDPFVEEPLYRGQELVFPHVDRLGMGGVPRFECVLALVRLARVVAVAVSANDAIHAPTAQLARDVRPQDVAALSTRVRARLSR